MMPYRAMERNCQADDLNLIQIIVLVNHFLINDSWYLVDLPGYGYAKISQTARVKLHKMINEFINESQEMVLLFVFISQVFLP